MNDACACGGTRAGFAQHRRKGTEPCSESRAAENAYQRDRRAKKKAAAPTLAWPTRPKVDGLITFLSVVPQEGSQLWNAEVWDLAPDQRRWFRYGTLEAVEPGGGIEFIERIVNEFDVTVVVMQHEAIAFWIGKSADFGGFLERLRVRQTVLYHLTETLDTADPLLGCRATIARSYRDPEVKILPKDAPGEYVARKLEEIAGDGQYHLRADWVGEVALPSIPYAASVAEKRREKDADDPEHPRRVPGATVARGRLFGDKDSFYTGKPDSKPEPVKDLPGDHPAQRQETYIGTSVRNRR